jgi:hypothetical protein
MSFYSDSEDDELDIQIRRVNQGLPPTRGSRHLIAPITSRQTLLYIQHDPWPAEEAHQRPSV